METPSDMTDKDDTFAQTILVLSLQSFSFIVYMICLAFVIWKIQGHIMGKIIIMLVLFALVFSVRVTLDILRTVYIESGPAYVVATKIMRLLRDIFTKLQWFGIYYFVLEVFDV